MSTSPICVTIPDSVIYIVVFGAVAAVIAAIGNLCGMSCPFVSNMLQNRIHRKNTGLLVNVNEQISATRNSNNV